MHEPPRPTALVLYHYFHPDDVVSAQHYAGLCLGLAERGWRVTVLPSSRGCRNERASYPKYETWQGVDIRRIWRPRFPQSSKVGRVLNSAWMLTAWSIAALRHRPDVLIIGTDPIFSVLVALPWRLLRPKTKRFHWCFDLHPEAAIAEGMVGPEHFVVRTLRPFLRWAYQSCHLLGSLGPCMTERLHIYHPSCPIMTLTPWALFEPETPAPVDPEERQALFGDATLGLLYSGNFGKAHEAECFLALARKLRAHRGIQFAFSIRGNRAAELVQMVTPEDTNIRFVDFAHQDRLDQRLGAADIHLVSLRSNYVGTVVPSKFQGAIATGRAILYAGPEDSAVATWVREFDLGWNLTPASVESVAQALIKLSQDPLAIAAQNQRCHRIYQQRFSRQAMLDLADCSLRAMRDVTCGLTEPRRV